MLLHKLWKDEAGFVVSAELVMVGTLLVVGLVTAAASVQEALDGEVQEVASSLRSLNQSYAYRGMHGSCGPYGYSSWTAGSAYISPANGVPEGYAQPCLAYAGPNCWSCAPPPCQPCAPPCLPCQPSCVPCQPQCVPYQPQCVPCQPQCVPCQPPCGPSQVPSPVPSAPAEEDAPSPVPAPAESPVLLEPVSALPLLPYEAAFMNYPGDCRSPCASAAWEGSACYGPAYYATSTGCGTRMPRILTWRGAGCRAGFGAGDCPDCMRLPELPRTRICTATSGCPGACNDWEEEAASVYPAPIVW